MNASPTPEDGRVGDQVVRAWQSVFLMTVAWAANERPQLFTADTFTKPFLCLQKAQNTGEVVAFGKDFWSKQPDTWAADVLFVHPCEFSASARANSMTKAGGVSRVRGGAHSLTPGK